MRGHARKRQVHGLHAHHLAKARLAVQAQQHAVVDPHGHIGAGVEPTFQNRIHIARGHAHSMRVVTTQVGQHQIGRHLARPIGGCASIDKQTGDGVFKFGGGNQVAHGEWGGGLGMGGMGAAWLVPNGTGVRFGGVLSAWVGKAQACHITAPNCQGTNSFCP